MSSRPDEPRTNSFLSTWSVSTVGIGVFKDVEGVARVANLDDIIANDYNLNIARYVEAKNGQKVLTVEEAMEQLRKSATAAFAAEDSLITILRREGLIS